MLSKQPYFHSVNSLTPHPVNHPLGDFRPSTRQLSPPKPKRLHPLIHPALLARSPPKLILRKINIPIRRHTECVRPLDLWIANKSAHGPILRKEDVDGVRFDAAEVDVVVGISFHAVADAFLGEGLEGLEGEELGGRGAGAKAGGRDRVEGAGGDGGEVEGCAVGGEGDAI